MGENGERVSPCNSSRTALSPPGFLAFVVAVIIFYLGKSVFIREPSCPVWVPTLPLCATGEPRRRAQKTRSAVRRERAVASVARSGSRPAASRSCPPFGERRLRGSGGTSSAAHARREALAGSRAALLCERRLGSGGTSYFRSHHGCVRWVSHGERI